MPQDSSHTEKMLGSEVQTPKYDSQLRELTFGKVLLKKFKQPAENQELILQAFEEEGWPDRIDNPLPRQTQHSVTVRDLNRNMKSSAIRFELDGTGNGIIWKPVAPA